MHTVKASEFKAKCLALMDEVARSGEAIVITKNGKPLVELAPLSTTGTRGFYGSWKNRIQIHGDLLQPLDADDWDALR